jgi:hypothetical protein
MEEIEVFSFLTAIKGDGLRVVPHPNETIAQVCLLFILMVVKATRRRPMRILTAVPTNA